MFYTFNQNNSGGSFYFEKESGISHYVVIEADSHKEANDKAESIGIYFDGVDSDNDCPCCGNRWYEVWEVEGTEQPTLYGEVIDSEWKDIYRWMGNDPELFIHYSDGRIVPIMG